MNLLGILVAIGFIIGANILEGGHPSAMLNLPAFLIVIGGAIGAVMVQFPIKVLLVSLKQFGWLISPPKLDLHAQSELLEGMSTTARQQGLLALENQVAQIGDAFTRNGLQMIVDGVDKEQLHQLLENEIEIEQHELEQSVKVFEALGGYTPTMGILGAVLGLIHAMGLLDRPEMLGPAIAVAFVATIYGVGSANILFLPVANRYKAINHDIAHFKLMVLEGLLSIASGENTMQLKRRLQVYIGEE
ncbi:flagellar motor protein [Pseudaeromonas sharmana]|uniref:Flagellar motor protein n=1 Tax=Pseudaeromonas sharmana TaxID=328412 RepID=A0ABV8CIZ6_9GAMM